MTNFVSAFDIPALSSWMLYEGVSVYHLLLGAILMILAGLIILGGLKRIAAFSEKVVPFMVIAFVTGSLLVIFMNYGRIIPSLSAIFKTAFSPSALWGGATGLMVREVVTQGFKRGVFSNEAGLGSSVMVHANADVKEPVRQGMWGIFEVFTDTLVVCTMTALVILTSGVIDLETGALADGATGDATLVAKAFGTVMGGFGEKFIAVAILFFAFTTVIGWSFYAEKAIEYLGSKRAVRIYKLIFVLMIMAGALLTSSLAWDISDTFNGLMMVPNLIGVVSLSGLVRKITRNYIDRRMCGKAIKPMLSYDETIQKEIEENL